MLNDTDNELNYRAIKVSIISLDWQIFLIAYYQVLLKSELEILTTELAWQADALLYSHSPLLDIAVIQ